MRDADEIKKEINGTHEYMYSRMGAYKSPVPLPDFDQKDRIVMELLLDIREVLREKNI